MESELSTPKTRRENEVWQACDDLWAHSASTRHLTGDNIRDQLVKLGYKRGSPNEIYRYRSSWKDSRGVRDAADTHESDVKESDPISRAVSLVYEQMRTQTNDTVEKLVEDYEARLKAALLEEEALRATTTRLTAENASLQSELLSLRDQNNTLELALRKEKQSYLILNEQLKGARDQSEMLTQEHKALILELKSFHEREIDLWRTQHAELGRMFEAQKKQSQGELERQGAIFSEELMQLKTLLRQTIEEREQAKSKASSMEEAAKAAKSRSDKLEEECGVSQKSNAFLEGEAEGLRQYLADEKKETIRWQRIVERYLSRATKKRSSR